MLKYHYLRFLSIFLGSDWLDNRMARDGQYFYQCAGLDFVGAVPIDNSDQAPQQEGSASAIMFPHPLGGTYPEVTMREYNVIMEGLRDGTLLLTERTPLS